MKKVIFIILSFLGIYTATAQDLDTMVNNANKLYTQGKYQEAVELYESIVKLGYESSELYYNIGNSYYKQNVIARAILNYEKALQLSPNDVDVKYNLDLVNRFVVDKIEVLPVFFVTGWIRGIRNSNSSDVWAIISMICFVVTLIFLSFYLYSRGIGLKKASFWIGSIVLFISLISFIFSKQQKHKIVRGNTAIVMNPSVTVKSSPDISGTDLFVIHEGTKVWIEDKLSDWNEVKLSDGSKGWLKEEDIEII